MYFGQGIGFISIFLLSTVLAFEGVKLYRGQTAHITSSTLTWANYRHGDKFPPNAVPIGTGGPLWCRAQERSIWLSGAVVQGKCRVSFLGKVRIAENFNVLVSLNGSARLVGVPWDSYQAYPQNSITTPDVLLAFAVDPESSAVLPGFVNEQDRRAFYLKGTQSIKASKGRIITEKEPVAYTLEDVTLNNVVGPTHEEFLQEFTLENPSTHSTIIRHEVTILSPHGVYFGKMKGTIIDLPTKVSGPDIFPVSIKWGYWNDLSRHRRITVEHNMPGKSKVRVRLLAVIRDLEATYYGTLTSTYDDSVELKRKISGIHTEKKLAQLKAEYDVTRDLNSDKPLDSHPASSTIILHSTTTTPSPYPRAGKISGNTNVHHIGSGLALFFSLAMLMIA